MMVMVMMVMVMMVMMVMALMMMISHLATPQLAEKLRSLSLRIGKPGAPPNPPSDTLFLSDLN